MDRICVCALKKDRKRLLEFLQRQGSVELAKAGEDDVFSSMDTQASCTLFEKNARTAASALEILNRYCPAPSSMLDFLNGRKMLFRRRERGALCAVERAHGRRAERL
jgi:V/A-type H+-transporting ATPase subunit I